MIFLIAGIFFGYFAGFTFRDNFIPSRVDRFVVKLMLVFFGLFLIIAFKLK